MTRGYFISGTDTGVGKTYVTCALARRARTLGHRVFAFKPVETGCVELDGRFAGADQELLAGAAGDWQRGDLRGVYRFQVPAAPLVAASAESQAVDLGLIAMTYRAGVDQADFVLVEGAGGWRVPVTETEDTAGLARVTDLPVVLVARATLGTINHSLLTLEAVERDGFAVAALVLSRQPADDPSFAESNAEQIRRRWPGRVMVFGRVDSDLDVLIG